MRFFVLLFSLALLLMTNSVTTFAQQGDDEESTLIVYSSVSQLLAGDVTIGISIPEMQQTIDHFTPDWAVVGIGTRTHAQGNGELMPMGTVDHVHYWWVDPSSETQAAVVDLAPVMALADADATPTSVMDFEPEFPFVAISVADPDEALVFEAQSADNLHEWIISTLAETDITLAGLSVTGDFGAVSTTVGYNLPTTGVDTSGVYANTDYFHFADYEPAAWTMSGFYVRDPELQTVVSTAERPVHLHGFQPDVMIGGHIASAVVENLTLTVYPLDNVIQTRDDAAA